MSDGIDNRLEQVSLLSLLFISIGLKFSFRIQLLRILEWRETEHGEVDVVVESDLGAQMEL
jgi:hypothetical protein